MVAGLDQVFPWSVDRTIIARPPVGATTDPGKPIFRYPAIVALEYRSGVGGEACQ
jgi:hypothetical protein